MYSLHFFCFLSHHGPLKQSTQVLFSIHFLPSKSIEVRLSYPNYTLPPCSKTSSYICQLFRHLLILTKHHLFYHYATQLNARSNNIRVWIQQGGLSNQAKGMLSLLDSAKHQEKRERYFGTTVFSTYNLHIWCIDEVQIKYIVNRGSNVALYGARN